MNLFPTERGRAGSFLRAHSDEEAFREDLEKVGADMRGAMKTIENSVHKKVVQVAEDQRKV